jgi:ABC-type multidrug transport system ATPase subunit
VRPPAAVDHWIERLLLTEHAGTRLADLSKGTAQKVGLAQALLVRPACWCSTSRGRASTRSPAR